VEGRGTELSSPGVAAVATAPVAFSTLTVDLAVSVQLSGEALDAPSSAAWLTFGL